MSAQYLLYNQDTVLAELTTVTPIGTFPQEPDNILTIFGFVFTKDNDLLRFLKKAKEPGDIRDGDAYITYVKGLDPARAIILTKEGELLSICFKLDIISDRVERIMSPLPRLKRWQIAPIFTKDTTGKEMGQILSKTAVINSEIQSSDTNDDVVDLASKLFISNPLVASLFDKPVLEAFADQMPFEFPAN